MSQKQVLVIGAGISGLALSQGLKQALLPFHVFEGDPTPASRPQGYRFRINPQGAIALQDLLTVELWERFVKVCAEGPFMGGRFNALNGQPMKSLFGGGPPPGGMGRSYTADRTTTRDLLMRGLEGKISFGKKLVRYEETEEGVIAFFEDGSNAHGSFLVGAEGVGSVVRKQYLPAYLILDTDYRCIYGKTKITRELLERFDSSALKGMSTLWDESRKRTMLLLLEAIRFKENELRSELPEDYVYWVLGDGKEEFLMPDHERLQLLGAEAVELSLKITEDWHPSYQALLELQEKDMTSVLRISMASPEMPAWESSGRVALIGDAVHVMPPTGGVGANTALQDAAALCAVLGQDVSKSSVTRYDEDMRARAREAILGSARGGKHLMGMRDWRTFEVIDV